MDDREQRVEEVVGLIKKNEREIFDREWDAKTLTAAEQAVRDRVGQWYEETVDLRATEEWARSVAGDMLKRDVDTILRTAVAENEKRLAPAKEAPGTDLAAAMRARGAQRDRERDDADRDR